MAKEADYQDADVVTILRNPQKGKLLLVTEDHEEIGLDQEIKTKLPDPVIECRERGDFPPEHKTQCQGALWVVGREDRHIVGRPGPYRCGRKQTDTPWIRKEIVQ